MARKKITVMIKVWKRMWVYWWGGLAVYFIDWKTWGWIGRVLIWPGKWLKGSFKFHV